MMKCNIGAVLILALGACLSTGAVLADYATPPYTQTMLKVDGNLWAVSIGPGGPDVEFGSSKTNGGLYKISKDKAPEDILPSDGKGFRNPTGLVEHDGTIFIVDGAELIAIDRDRNVLWRTTYNAEGTFFYDIELMADGHLVLSDFGHGRLVLADPQNGKFSKFPESVSVPGLARIVVSGTTIYGTSWGSDDAFDGAVYRIFKDGDQWKTEQVVSGFGNPEAIELVGTKVIVGAYRGHKSVPDARMFVVESGKVRSFNPGIETKGASDFARFGNEFWMSMFYDSRLHPVKVGTLEKN